MTQLTDVMTSSPMSGNLLNTPKLQAFGVSLVTHSKMPGYTVGFDSPFNITNVLLINQFYCHPLIKKTLTGN